MSDHLNDISELAADGVHKKVIAAARVILGGLDTEAFWGFSFLAFTRRFDTRLRNYLPDPARTHLDLSPGFDAIRNLEDSRVDRIADPVRNVSHDDAERLAKRLIVIGLAGERGSGRASVANHLVDAHGFTRMTFEDPLRMAASILYNVPLHYFTDLELSRKPVAKLGMSPEKLMQVLGGEVCQGLRRSVWNDRLLLRVAAVSRLEPSGQPKIVVSGLAFQDEAEFIRSLEHGRVAWMSRTGSFNSPHIQADDVLLTNNVGLSDFVRAAAAKLGYVAPGSAAPSAVAASSAAKDSPLDFVNSEPARLRAARP